MYYVGAIGYHEVSLLWYLNVNKFLYRVAPSHWLWLWPPLPPLTVGGGVNGCGQVVAMVLSLLLVDVVRPDNCLRDKDWLNAGINRVEVCPFNY